ncbi:MAG: hypothetical protein GY694_05705 [Gammaproteobacteria bacterium]|nr:hypothetical protein [Gammaproteobacteria bacterium]
MSYNTLHVQMPIYLIVGGLNTIGAYALFALLLMLGLHYTIATLLPGIVSIYVGYVANKHIVFRAKDAHKWALLYYYLFYFLVYLMNIGIQAVLYSLHSYNGYINGAIALVITTIFSFAINKWVFFSTTRDLSPP